MLGQEALQLKAPTVVLLLLCQRCLKPSHVFCQLTPVAGLLHTYVCTYAGRHTQTRSEQQLHTLHMRTNAQKARADPFEMESLDV